MKLSETIPLYLEGVSMKAIASRFAALLLVLALAASALPLPRWQPAR